MVRIGWMGTIAVICNALMRARIVIKLLQQQKKIRLGVSPAVSISLKNRHLIDAV